MQLEVLVQALIYFNILCIPKAKILTTVMIERLLMGHKESNQTNKNCNDKICTKSV